MKIKVSLIDDKGQVYEGECDLTKTSSEGRTGKISKSTVKTWYRKGSTIEKIIKLADEGFFDSNRTLMDIIEGLKAKDYHLKQSDLTLPLRKIVRKGLLNKTKDLEDGEKSRQWTYIKP